jgi:hypothetical protein
MPVKRSLLLNDSVRMEAVMDVGDVIQALLLHPALGPRRLILGSVECSLAIEPRREERKSGICSPHFLHQDNYD